MGRFIRYMFNWAIGSTIMQIFFDYLTTTNMHEIIDLIPAFNAMYLMFLGYFIICFVFDKPVRM